MKSFHNNNTNVANDMNLFNYQYNFSYFHSIKMLIKLNMMIINHSLYGHEFLHNIIKY